MKASELLVKVRQRILDENKNEYKDPELTGYLNDAISFVNRVLIGIRSPYMTKELNFSGSTHIPTGFVSWSGDFPVYIVDGQVKTLNPLETVNCIYFAEKPQITDLNEEIPFGETICSILINMTVIYALNRNQFDLSQDRALLQDLITAVQNSGG